MAIALLVRSPQHEDQMSCTGGTDSDKDLNMGVGVLTPNGLSLMKVQIVLSNSPAARLTATGTSWKQKKVPAMKDKKKFGKRGSRTHYIKFAIVKGYRGGRRRLSHEGPEGESLGCSSVPYHIVMLQCAPGTWITVKWGCSRISSKNEIP